MRTNKGFNSGPPEDPESGRYITITLRLDEAQEIKDEVQLGGVDVNTITYPALGEVVDHIIMFVEENDGH